MAKRKVSLSIEEDIIKEGKKAAIDLDTSFSEVVEKLVREWLQSLNKPFKDVVINVVEEKVFGPF